MTDFKSISAPTTNIWNRKIDENLRVSFSFGAADRLEVDVQFRPFDLSDCALQKMSWVQMQFGSYLF